jgi:hypothetical protein
MDMSSILGEHALRISAQEDHQGGGQATYPPRTGKVPDTTDSRQIYRRLDREVVYL